MKSIIYSNSIELKTEHIGSLFISETDEGDIAIIRPNSRELKLILYLKETGGSFKVAEHHIADEIRITK